MSCTRVIRKYPNRRLYDTTESRYVTLADIRALVVGDVRFEVIDKKSGDDITRTILLQVISDQEQCGHPVMSAAFLEHVIRAHDSDAPERLANFLEHNMAEFVEVHELRDDLSSEGNGADREDDGASRPYAPASAMDEPSPVRAAGSRDPG